MNSYLPIYLKKYENIDICPRCSNNLIKKKILSYSYLDECKKCTKSSMYGLYHINSINNNNLIYNNETDICRCKTRYIYRYDIKCNKCCECDICNNKLSYKDLYKIENINDKHICSMCFYNNKHNNINENINY